MRGQPHDRLFREVFSDPANARGELQAVLPAEVTARIDWSTLRLEPGTFVEPALKEKRTDLLFSVMLAGRPAYLYVLMEHQSSVERWMGLRLLGYMVRIWEKHRKGNKKARRLPPILPVLVCHDEEAWSAPRSFHELLDVSEDIASFVLRHVVSFEYLIDDLSSLREEELRARAMTAFAKVALFCLQRARGAEDMAVELERWLDALRELLAAPNGVEAFQAILRYILLVNESPPERLRDLTQALGPKAEEAFMTGAQILLEQGRREGEAKGKAEGKAEGILRVLAARKLSVTDAERTRILTCTDLGQLDRWLERAAIAASTSEVFAD